MVYKQFQDREYRLDYAVYSIFLERIITHRITCIYILLTAKSFFAKLVYYKPLFNSLNHIFYLSMTCGGSSELLTHYHT